MKAKTKKTKHPRTHQTSVRARVLDLLESYDGEWFTIRALRNEYSERFGPVKLATMRRAVFTELSAEDCEVWVRYRSDLGSQPVLEVAWAMEIEEEE